MMNHMRVTVVGCSGSVPGPDSAASCYLIEADAVDSAGAQRTWRVLLDLGSGALGPLQRYLDPLELDAVLLSHLHPDHYFDLSGLYVMAKHAPKDPLARVHPIPVWGPVGTSEQLARAIGVPEQPGLAPELTFNEWVAGRPVQLGPLLITPVPMRHPVLAFGLRIEYAGRVLAYTGDTDICPELTALLHDADLVLADAAFIDSTDGPPGVHLTAARAAQAVTEAGGVKRLILTHIPPWIDPQVSLAQARREWSGPLDVAYARASYSV